MKLEVLNESVVEPKSVQTFWQIDQIYDRLVKFKDGLKVGSQEYRETGDKIERLERVYKDALRKALCDEPRLAASWKECNAFLGHVFKQRNEVEEKIGKYTCEAFEATKPYYHAIAKMWLVENVVLEHDTFFKPEDISKEQKDRIFQVLHGIKHNCDGRLAFYQQTDGAKQENCVDILDEEMKKKLYRALMTTFTALEKKPVFLSQKEALQIYKDAYTAGDSYPSFDDQFFPALVKIWNAYPQDKKQAKGRESAKALFLGKSFPEAKKQKEGAQVGAQMVKKGK